MTAVFGSVSVSVPERIRRVPIESAQDLYDAMMKEAPEHDVIIQAAAVCDYRVDEKKATKIKKKAGEPLVLTLTENPDVAKAVGEIKKEGQILCGFAAETDHVKQNAQEKLKKKNLDMIIANDVTMPGAGFNVDTNIAALITAKGTEELPLMTKRELADVILDKVMEMRK